MARSETTVNGDDIVVIDAPDAGACLLPPAQRFCVSVCCPAALTPRGANTYTRCALDIAAALVPDHRQEALVRRRVDCARSKACETAWLRGPHGDDQAQCPDPCDGYVRDGGIVPAAALARLVLAARKERAST
jgi:hypothetical protein